MVRLWDETCGVRVWRTGHSSPTNGLTNEQTIAGWWHRDAVAWVDGVFYIVSRVVVTREHGGLRVGAGSQTRAN